MADQMADQAASQQTAVYVYEAPVRIWHWVNAFAIIALCVTGYFIGSPLSSVSGEASDHYVMGYMRFVHFAAAYIFIIGFVFRAYWAIVGNSHSREIYLPRIFSKDFWDELWHEIKWYSFLVDEPKKYTGHNPLAILAMHLMFVWGSIFMIISGLALYGEGAGMGSWQYQFFSSWLIPLMGQSQDVHTYHHLVMWLLIIFAIIHIYVAVREDIMSRQSIISSMISGWRLFKDNRPSND
ncbi:MAG: putative Ni/Fe-hydrogenase B-type cytochrome subunit [Methyloligella sp.]|nr:MAG: putative Ni/Fe-hydrogenase B-type cytochrome subunit [Methyloligella sp.]